MTIDQHVIETITDKDYPDICNLCQKHTDVTYNGICGDCLSRSARSTVEICENCGYTISATREAE